MQKENIGRRKLSVFTYFFILLCVISITVLVVREINLNIGFDDILYQKDVDSSVRQENKYYINKIKDEYGITVSFGEEEKSFADSVNANIQYDENIANNNIKIIYIALKKYPKEVFDIFKDYRYNLHIVLVSEFNDNNIALASKNTLNQYRIYLSNNSKFERAFHHEFFHVLEYYMENKTDYLYFSWNSYNPIGFEYEDNIKKLTNENVYNEYATEDENKNAYFLTKYAKVSPKEDRAEIFAELMGLTKKVGYLKNGTKIREKVNYLMTEVHEYISILDFYFSYYLN